MTMRQANIVCVVAGAVCAVVLAVSVLSGVAAIVLEYEGTGSLGIVHSGGSGIQWGQIDIDGDLPVTMYSQDTGELTVLHFYPTVTVSVGWPLRLIQLQSEHEEVAYIDAAGHRHLFLVGDRVSTRAKMTPAGVWCVLLLALSCLFVAATAICPLAVRRSRGFG